MQGLNRERLDVAALVGLAVGARGAGHFGCLQVEHTWTRGAAIPCWARRLSRLDAEVFRFGTAMSGCGVYRRFNDKTAREGSVSSGKACARPRLCDWRARYLPQKRQKCREKG